MTPINHERLLTLLEPVGFELVWLSSIERMGEFSRKSAEAGAYEFLVYRCHGRRGHAVGGLLRLSVTRRVAGHGMLESRVLSDVAEDADRGWTMIRSATHAREWEHRFAEVGPKAVVQFSQEIAPELVRRTAAARRASTVYLRRIDSGRGLWRRIRELQERVGPECVLEAERMARSAMFWRGAEDHYEVACLGILAYEGEVEPAERSWRGEDPRTCPQLMWRIQFIADELIAADDELLRHTTVT